MNNSRREWAIKEKSIVEGRKQTERDEDSLEHG
jgi:hypothetical protein